MAHDPVAHDVGRSAPMAGDAVLRAVERLEGASLEQLERAAADAQAGFRAWTEDPANAGRPFIDCPPYVDRIAAETLIERRLFTE